MKNCAQKWCRSQVGRSGVDRASSSDKIPLLYPETLEVPIRSRVQLPSLELGDNAGEKHKKVVSEFVCIFVWGHLYLWKDVM